MKKIYFILVALLATLGVTSCGNDAWTYDKTLEHVYFFGPQVWGYDDIKKGNNNVVHYEVKQGETVAVPMQFWCEFNRNYDVVTYYYTAPKPSGEKYYATTGATKESTYNGTELVCGVDYVVVDEAGNTLTPSETGAYSLVWPNALKGVKQVYIKALPGGKKGSFNLMTCDPAGTKPVNSDVATTVQHTEKDYEVRIFSQNYRVCINIL